MIKAPNWQPKAVPTLRGWEYNGELIIARKHTSDQLEEYVGDLQENTENGPRLLLETEPKAPMIDESPQENEEPEEPEVPKTKAPTKRKTKKK